MPTLIIPDIHNKWRIAERIIAENPADKRIFLGDIYDDFGDTLEQVEAMAWWHKQALGDPKNVFLWGNHDLPYAYPHLKEDELYCSGNTRQKAEVINSVLSPEDWAKTKVCAWEGDWLLSHAGFSATFLQQEDIEEMAQSAMKSLEHEHVPILFRAGWARGGDQAKGGVTWLDWNEEFEPIAGIQQIVGHTPGKTPRRKGDNWCLDTHLHHAATLDAGGNLGIILVQI